MICFPSLKRILAPGGALMAVCLLTACQNHVPPVSSIYAHLQKSAVPGPQPTKQYQTNRDWRHGDWVIKRGATIAFRKDGIGSFSARVYTVRPARNQEFHFQSVQYGRDGNILFPAPPADLGYAIHARSPYRDYPVDVNFGFDSRQYEYIDRVTFTGRVRGAEKTTQVQSSAKDSSSAKGS